MSSSFSTRLWRACRLDADIYEEVEADRTSIRQACVVVGSACFAIGIGRWIQSTGSGLDADQRLFQTALAVIEPMVIWIGGSAFSFMVGATFFRGPETETDFAEVLRTTGFAFTPAVLRVFAFLQPPTLGLGIDLFARAWVFVAFVVAIRQALDFTTTRAIGTYGIAAVLLWLVLWGLSVAPLPI